MRAVICVLYPEPPSDEPGDMLEYFVETFSIVLERVEKVEALVDKALAGLNAK